MYWNKSLFKTKTLIDLDSPQIGLRFLRPRSPTTRTDHQWAGGNHPQSWTDPLWTDLIVSSLTPSLCSLSDPEAINPPGLLFPRAKPNALPMSKTLPPNAGWGAWEACGFLFTASPRLAVCIHVHRRTTDPSHTPIGAQRPPASAQLSHPFSGAPTPRASYSSVWCPTSSFEDYDVSIVLAGLFKVSV